MSEEKEFWNKLYDLLISAQDDLGKALFNLAQMQQTLDNINIKVFKKFKEEVWKKNITKE